MIGSQRPSSAFNRAKTNVENKASLTQTNVFGRQKTSIATHERPNKSPFSKALEEKKQLN